MSIYSKVNVFLFSLVVAAEIAASCGAETLVPCNNANFGLAPYVWKSIGSGPDTRIEATVPGAYFKAIAKGTKIIGLAIDGAANTGCSPSSMPVIEYSVDDGPFITTQLSQTGGLYTLPIAQGLNPTTSHKLEVYFRAADLGSNRWTASTAHLRVAGISIDDGGTLAPYPMRSKRAIGYGDSITEGVGIDALFTSWAVLDPNNARGSWLPLVCAALDCEYGQIGSGGQGMVTHYNVPGCVTAWDHYDSTTSRLSGGHLVPEPDYLFCAHGNNDHVDITSAYIGWLSAVRSACPNTRLFCIVPPAGIHRSEITAAVNSRNQAGDDRVYLIDLPQVTPLAPNLGKPTQGSYDGGHLNMYGQALLAAHVAVKVQEILIKERKR